MKLCLVVSFLLTAMVTAQTPCVDNLDKLVISETAVTDTTVRRTYVLCPDTTFITGDLEGGRPVGGSSAIVLRPNVTIQCGANGRRSNNCVVTGGFGLFAGPTMFSDPSTLGVANVVGVTFRALKNTTFFIGRYNGIVSVRDCAFVDSSSAPNIYIEAAGRAIDRRLANSDSRQDDFVAVRNEIEMFMGNEIRDAGGVHRFLQENSGVLNVTFTGCLFGNNRYATQSGINNTLFWLASVNQGTVFKNCTFQNNDYGSRVVNPLTQTLIFNNGGSLSLDTNCFTNNKVLNFGYVNSLSPLSFARNNYGTIPTNSTACEFFSVFPDGPGSPIFNPICIKFDAASCPLLNAPAPTSKPTSSPIQSPATQPVSPPAGACGIKYAPCVVNSDCCSKLCRGPIEAGVMRTCSGPNTSSKGSFKLSNGRGGAGGGASKRD